MILIKIMPTYPCDSIPSLASNLAINRSLALQVFYSKAKLAAAIKKIPTNLPPLT